MSCMNAFRRIISAVDKSVLNGNFHPRKMSGKCICAHTILLGMNICSFLELSGAEATEIT